MHPPPPQEQHTRADQSPRETEKGERGSGPDLEAAGRDTNSRQHQGDRQGEAPDQEEIESRGETGEEENES